MKKKPKTFSGDLAHLPAALEPLTELDNWVGWSWELKQAKDGSEKWTKPPRVATDPSRYASVSDPRSWGTHEAAVKAVARRQIDGIGFVLTDTNIGAGDADECRNADTGALVGWAEKLNIEANDIYREVTPSGSGFRLLGTAEGDSLHKRFPFARDSREGIELYRCCNRFICITGLELAPKCRALSSIDALLDTLFARYNNKKSDKKSSKDKLDYDDLIKSGAEEPERSDLFHRVVWHLARRGLSIDQITDELAKYPHGIGEKYAGRLRQEVERSFNKRPHANAIEVIPGQLPSIVDAAEEALLASDQDIYQRGLLVHPAIVPLRASDDRETSAWQLLPVTENYLVDVMTDTPGFVRWDARSESWVPIDAPVKIARTLLSRAGRWKARVLAGIVSAPFLRRDGTICQEPGYDKHSGLLFRPDGQEFPPIPDTPSKDDALDALAKLQRPLRGFPFVTAADRAVELSAILTALVRSSLPSAPLHGFNAPVAGSGKSKLVDIAAMVATGFEAPVIAQGRDEEELEKRLDAELLSGTPLVSIDNCSHPLESSFLCMLLTQSRVKVRILGKTEQPELPSDLMVCATGNGLTFVGDLTRRALRCTIDARMERPELRKFAGDPVDLARKQRAKLVVAALTILRAYQVSGERVEVEPFGSFEGWSRTVREALIWLGCADPCKTVDNVRADDPQRLALLAVLAQWRRNFEIGRQLKVRELIDYASCKRSTVPGGNTGEARNQRADLRTALLNVGGVDGLLSNKRLGVWLARSQGRVIDGVCLKPGKMRDGYPRYQMVKAP